MKRPVYMAFVTVLLLVGFGIGWFAGRRVEAPAPPPMAKPAPVPGPATPPASRPASLRALDAPLAQRAVIVSIDGLRPDLLIGADVPNLRRLLPASCYTFWALTVDDPYVYTLPSHATMLTGVNPSRHGVIWNNYIEAAYPREPTLFDLARRSGLTTAMVSGKMKLTALARPDALNWLYLPEREPVDDLEVVAERAVQILREHRPGVLFVHFAGVDGTGHEWGWGSPEQQAALERVDVALGRVVDAIDNLALADSTLLIVTADHGGAGFTHWTDPRSRTIPWIARGPGMRRGFDLNRLPALEVRTEDTFATVAIALGIPIASDNEGRFVEEMLEERELLRDAPGIFTQPATRPVGLR